MGTVSMDTRAREQRLAEIRGAAAAGGGAPARPARGPDQSDPMGYAGRRIERLRADRVVQRASGSVAPLFAGKARELARLSRRVGAIGQAWAEVCPGELVERTSIGSLRAGVLTIEAGDAPTRFRLERFLASGGRRAFLRRCPVSVRKLRVVVSARAGAGR